MARKGRRGRKSKSMSIRVLDIAAAGAALSALNQAPGFSNSTAGYLMAAANGQNPSASLINAARSTVAAAKANAVPLAIGLTGYGLARKFVPRRSVKIPGLPVRIGA